MKKTIISALLGFASFQVAQGATTITATNAALGTTGFAQQVITAVNGTAFTGGSVLIGTFSTPAGLGTTVGPISLETFGWTLFGSAPFSTNAAAPGIFGSVAGAGQTQLGVVGNLPTTVTGPFIGNNIYAVVANAAGNDFVVWNSGINFAVEDAVLGGSPISFQTRNVTLTRGIVDPDGNIGLTGALVSRNGQAAVTFGVIPEPSAALLGAIGALGLLRRRRN